MPANYPSVVVMSSNPYCPVEAGKKYTVKIGKVNPKGEGIANIDGFTIFVKGAREGEGALVRVIEVFRTYATARKV